MTNKPFKEKLHLINEYDLYKILDISPEITQEQLVIHYNELSKKLHPARYSFQLLSSQESKEMKAIFDKISDAYSILSDPQSRFRYTHLRNDAVLKNQTEEIKNLYEKFKETKKDKAFKDKSHILGEGDLYVILDISPDITQEELVQHYKKLVKKYHPDKYSFQLLSSQELKEVNAIFAKISDAYNTLKEPQSRVNYNEIRKNVLLQAQTRNIILEQKTVDSLFKDSKIDPEKAKKEQANKFLIQGIDDYNNSSFDNAIKNIKAAIEIVPKEAKYHAYLGMAMEKKGWVEYAKSEYKIALSYDPNNKIAQEKIKALNSKEAPEKSENKHPGLISKLTSIFQRK